MRTLILVAALLATPVAHAAEDFRPLSKNDVMLVQTFMYDIMGFILQGPPDGVMGSKSRAALAKLQGDIDAAPTGYVTAEQFETMKELVAAGPPTDRQWAAISVKAGDSQAFFAVSGHKLGSEAYRDAEARCNANPDGSKCITGVTYGTETKPAWVAAMQCVHEQVGYAAVWFGATEQEAYDNVEKQLDAMGVTKSDRCFRVASIRSDGTESEEPVTASSLEDPQSAADAEESDPSDVESRGETSVEPDALNGSSARETTDQTFGADVLDPSNAAPVVVSFWAPWCGPCRDFSPVLEAAVTAAQGGLTLLTMNIDDHPQIAEKLGIKSIPATIAFRDGRPLDGFTGAVSEREAAAFIERIAGEMQIPASFGKPVARVEGLPTNWDGFHLQQTGEGQEYCVLITEDNGLMAVFSMEGDLQVHLVAINRSSFLETLRRSEQPSVTVRVDESTEWTIDGLTMPDSVMLTLTPDWVNDIEGGNELSFEDAKGTRVSLSLEGSRQAFEALLECQSQLPD